MPWPQTPNLSIVARAGRRAIEIRVEKIRATTSRSTAPNEITAEFEDWRERRLQSFLQHPGLAMKAHKFKTARQS
jgi:hypothetical protein